MRKPQFLPLETVWADSRADQTRRVLKGAVASGYSRFQTGDVVCPKVTPTFQTGRSMITEGVGAGTTELHVLRARPGTDPRWICYAVRSNHFLAEGVTAFEGVAGLQRVPAEFVEDFRIADVPSDEQRRIADFLDDRVARIDQIITTRQQQARSLDEAFAETRSAAVTGRLAPDVESTDLVWAPVVRQGWTVRRLQQLAVMGTGHTPSRSESDYWVDCTIPWLTTTDVHRFRKDQIDSVDTTEISISELGLANSAAVMHPAGTVALSRTASAGFSVIMDRNMATSQDFVTWTPGPSLESKYLLHTLRVMRPYLLGYLAVGSTHKTIYFPDLMDLRIPLPSLQEQRTAIAAVDQAAERREQLTSAILGEVGLLQEYKQSLITAAVSGELDVTTASTRIPSMGVGS